MGLFGNKREGGLMDVIRCDESDYLVWKWSPAADGRSTRKENAIRYGSSLRVKAGEVAVFVYSSNGSAMDYIEGPCDTTIKTANFPVLTGLVGAAFGGSSPFQAEVYFINMEGMIQLPFFIPRVEITDPRLDDYSVPAAVKGSMMFNISDYKKFIALHRLRSFEMEDFAMQIRDPMISYVSSVVGRSPKMCNFSIYRIGSYLIEISKFLETELRSRVEEDFGINLRQVNLSSVELDKSDEGYKRLDKIIKLRSEMIADKQTEVTMQNIEAQQKLNEDLQWRRNEEAQRAQKLQTESTFIGAHQINVQGEVARTAAESLGEWGRNGAGGGVGGGGGMDPAGMMTGMMMGTAVGGGMANMMTGMMQGLNQPQPPTPPQEALAQYHLFVDGVQKGPYTMAQVRQMVQSGELNSTSYVWKAGMAQWQPANQLPELTSLFAAVPPPPPVPGVNR